MEMPPPEVTESIRQKALQALTHRFLTDAERLNASPEDLTEILKDQVTRWQETGHLSDPEPDTK